MKIIVDTGWRSLYVNAFIFTCVVRLTLQYHHIRWLTFEWLLPGKAVYHYLHWWGYEKLDLTECFVDSEDYCFTVYFLGFELMFSTASDYFKKSL